MNIPPGEWVGQPDQNGIAPTEEFHPSAYESIEDIPPGQWVGDADENGIAPSEEFYN